MKKLFVFPNFVLKFEKLFLFNFLGSLKNVFRSKKYVRISKIHLCVEKCLSFLRICEKIMFAFDKIFTFSFRENRFVFEFFKDVRIGVLVFLRFCNGLWSTKLASSTGSRRTLINNRSGV